MSRDIFDRDRVLHGQAMALALYARLVDQDTTVRGEACMAFCTCLQVAQAKTRTSEGKADVVVQHGDLANCPRILQLEDRLLLYTEHNDVLPAHADLERCQSYAGGVTQSRTAQVPFRTASNAYSTCERNALDTHIRHTVRPPPTWNKWPSGEKTVRAADVLDNS